MFLTTTHFANACFERRLFTSVREAETYARNASKERIHRIDHMVYMGKVTVNVWDVTHPVASDHLDDPISTWRD